MLIGTAKSGNPTFLTSSSGLISLRYERMSTLSHWINKARCDLHLPATITRVVKLKVDF